MSLIQVDRFRPAEWELYRQLRLSALSEAPDAFGGTYDESKGRPDDEWRVRLRMLDAEVDFPMCARHAGTPAGMGWVRRFAFGSTSDEGGPAHLYQMWTAPEFRGRGVGRALLDCAIAWAAQHADALELGVTWTDSPARRLYESAGFRVVGTPEPLRPGSHLEIRNTRIDF